MSVWLQVVALLSHGGELILHVLVRAYISTRAPNVLTGGNCEEYIRLLYGRALAAGPSPNLLPFKLYET